MNVLQKIFFHGTALLAAILQLLYETAFGPSHACKSGQQNGRSLGTSAGSLGCSRAPKQEASLSDDALVRLCRGLQEELRRKDKELTICKADVRALRLERRQVAQERKLDAVHSASLGRQLEQAAQDRAALQKEHGKVVTGMQEELTYYQHAKGAFQAQVHQLERDVGNLKVDLAAKGQGDTRLLEERSELIDAKARLGRQASELARRAQRAEADLAASRATAQALASNSAALEERLAEQACAHRSLQKRADELETEVASARSELGQEVEELRNVLNATLQDKAQLASQCSAVEAQASYLEADGLQLRAWLEEVILANEALEARVEALEASAAAAIHEAAALEGWVRGSVAEQAAASTRLASFQALSRMLETDGVCKSAMIGVLAIHLVQRERLLSQMRHAPPSRTLHALQCIEAVEDAEVKTAGVTKSASILEAEQLQHASSEVDPAGGSEPRTPSRFALPAPGMASASTSGQSSPCSGPAEESLETACDDAASRAACAASRAQSASAAELRRPSSALPPSMAAAKLAVGVQQQQEHVSSMRRTVSSAAGQIPLPRELLHLGRARSALPPRADRAAVALSGDWQQRLERHLRSRAWPGLERAAPAQAAQPGSIPGGSQLLADLAGSPAQPPERAYPKGPQVLATA